MMHLIRLAVKNPLDAYHNMSTNSDITHDKVDSVSSSDLLLCSH